MRCPFTLWPFQWDFFLVVEEDFFFTKINEE